MPIQNFILERCDPMSKFRRSRYPLIFIFFFLIISLQYLLTPTKERPSNSETEIPFDGRGRIEARLIDVHDGDTVTLKINNTNYRSRLIGIDAPEMGQRPWGEKAKRHLERLIKPGEKIIIETDIERLDKYDRLLVYLFKEDGTFINEKMLLDGYAVLLTIPPNVKYVEKFIKAEETARRLKKGIWGKNGLKERPVDYKERHRGGTYGD
jgi:micrococcal nuclease